MHTLSLAPRIVVTDDQLRGCTPWMARLLWLFSYGRCINVNRRLAHLIVSTRWLWFARRVRVVRFDEVARIAFRAQAIPSLHPWRFMFEDAASDAALFFISLVLKERGAELPLFAVWEEQPRPADWLDRLAGTERDAAEIGDEAAVTVVELLSRYIGAPIASR